MKVIAPIAVIAILLLQFSGAVPQSSVGGPMTLAIVFLGATVAVGMHEAWTMRRGALGWIVSIVVAFVGGFVAAEFGNLIFEPMLMLLAQQNAGRSLAAAGGPMLYVSLAAMMLLMLFGSWLALKVVSRWR
jgi:hypothetical protein